MKCSSIAIVFKGYLTKLYLANKRLHFKINLLMNFIREVSYFQKVMLISDSKKFHLFKNATILVIPLNK